MPQLLTIDTSCPLCPEDTRVQHARIIQPLDQISTGLFSNSASGSVTSKRSAMESTATRSSSFSHSTSRSSAHIARGDSSKPSSPGGMPKMKSSQSLHAMANSLNHLSAPLVEKHQKQPSKSLSKDRKGVKLPFPIRTSSFRRSVLNKHPLPRQPRFCFSSSGKSLFYWGEDCNFVSRFDLSIMDGQKPQAHRYDISGVQCIAAGEQRCAVIAVAGQVSEFCRTDLYGLF